MGLWSGLYASYCGLARYRPRAWPAKRQDGACAGYRYRYRRRLDAGIGLMKTLVLGGARSGKSAYAERLAAESGKAVTYIATAQVYDDSMAVRVKEHQSRRPPQWALVEEPFHLAQVLAEQDAAGHCIIVDCL